jgi:DNA-binding NarL/FixJ family response regulator
VWDDGSVPVRVLIVDDHPEFRAVARELLEDAGYVVTGEAEGAAEALAAAAAQSPDVVLLDIQLANGDGFEVSSTLARERDGPAVVLVSSRSAEDYGRRVARCGARGFISKSQLSVATLESLLW